MTNQERLQALSDALGEAIMYVGSHNGTERENWALREKSRLLLAYHHGSDDLRFNSTMPEEEE